MNLLEIDSQFTNQYQGLFDIQKNIIGQLKEYTFDLNKTEITDAIINRMDAFWYFHVRNNKELLERKTNTVAADFFTETCLLFIKLYFNNRFDVKSEGNIRVINKKKSIRPDISIWKNEQLLGVIELKVNDGWKRKEMHSHLTEREKQIKEIHPNTFFGVIAFWNFFDTTTDEWNNKYIGLKEFDNKNNPKTGGLVENLLKSIEKFSSQ